jgi:predicted transcriptional regulator
MSTTTIRLPEELKVRIAEAASRLGDTPHHFILQAVTEKTEQEEQRAAFEELGEGRFAEIIASGEAIPWAEMRTYLQDRLAGKTAKRPAKRKLA